MLISTNSWAQKNGIIIGNITDAYTLGDLSGVTISMEGGEQTVISDSNGNYKLSVVDRQLQC